jgi:hypothetical protein
MFLTGAASYDAWPGMISRYELVVGFREVDFCVTAVGAGPAEAGSGAVSTGSGSASDARNESSSSSPV